MGIISRCGSIVLIFALLSLAAPVTAATGMIQVQVHPGGGTVCLGTVCQDNPGTADGTGITTFENIEAGQYHMLNVYGTPGYKNYLGQIYLDPSGASLTRDIVLEPLPRETPATGTLRVYITPDGGRACLDRMCELSNGDGTGSWSVQFTDISANTNHNLTIVNEGYETYASDVRLIAGKTGTMTITLQPLPSGNATPVTPVSTPTPEPEPTRADLPGHAALLATMFCGIAWVLTRRGHT